MNTSASIPATLGAPAASAVAWPAVFAGAAAAAAFSLILFVLGTGLGLAALSPWSQRPPNAAAFGIAAIAWITVTQLMSSGLGGYLAGRLRSAWTGVANDEVHFRDTAHGFLAWAVATLLTAGVLASTLGSVAGATAQAGASVAGAATAATAAAAAAATDKTGADDIGYSADQLLRTDPSQASTASAPTGAAPQAEVTRILGRSLASDALAADDARYLGQLIAQRTGVPPAEAEQRAKTVFSQLQQRVNDAKTKAKEATDKARKATVGASLWLFVSLLIGAFTASFAATLGGRQRDL